MTGRQKPSVKTMLLVSGAVILVMFAISAFVWMQVPAGESVCTHWNAAGECDDHGSKFVGILLLPIVTVGMVGLFALIPGFTIGLVQAVQIAPLAHHPLKSR